MFWRWIFYAFWQGSLILFAAYYVLDRYASDEEGRFGGIWVSGEMVFGTIVIVSNMKILISSYQISFVMIFFIAASVLLYILFYTTISGGVVSSNEYGTFYMLMSAPQTYFSLILFTFMFVLVDTGSQYLNMYINKWYLNHVEKHKRV